MSRERCNIKLQRGINLGGFLSQCEHSLNHYQTFIGLEDIRKIAAWGFDHVRLPIDYEVLEQEDGSEKPEGFQLVDQVVRWCHDEGLSIILDLHKAYGYDFNDAGDSGKNNLFQDEFLQQRFLTLWQRIARHFGTYDHVAFELLNEVVEEENGDAWNALIKKAVLTIRKEAPNAYIIYGGIQWNSAKKLKLLEKPEDDKIIFTFHFYEPLLFTHQKAYWVKGMDQEQDVAYPDSMTAYDGPSRKIGDQGKAVYESGLQKIDRQLIEDFVQDAVQAAKTANTDLYCGEFGVIDRAPGEDTKRWFKDVNEVFKKYGIKFCIWNYKEKDFGISGTHYDSIRPELLELWNG